MSGLVIPFEPPRPFVALSSPGLLRTGERFFILDLHPSEADGGGVCGMWSGTNYAAGLDAARDFQAEGIRFIDRAGGAA